MKIEQYKIAQFNNKHDVTETQQFNALVEEVGELAEVCNRDSSVAAIEEELADVIFVARSLAEIHDINISAAVNQVTEANLQKDDESDGNKVTKSGLSIDHPTTAVSAENGGSTDD